MTEIESKVKEVEMADGTKVMVSNQVGSHSYLSDEAFEDMKDKYREMTKEDLRVRPDDEELMDNLEEMHDG